MKNGSGEKKRKTMADAFRRGLRQLYGTDENQGAGETLRAGRKKKVVRAASVLACIVAFTTTYALILPAVTLESQPVCGQEEHIHTDACYAYLDADGATVDPAVAVSLPVAGDLSTDAENAQMTLLSGSRGGYYESSESNVITEKAGSSDDGRTEDPAGDGSADMTGESGAESADGSVSALSAAVDTDSNPAAPLTDDISTDVTSAENTGSDAHSVTALPVDPSDDADTDASDSDHPDTTDIPMPDVTADASETVTDAPVADAPQSVRRVLICGQEEHQHSVECYPAKSDASTKKISPKSILTGLFGDDHSQSVTVDGTTITAEYKEGVLPDGVTMQAVPVPADAYVGAVADAVGKENTEIKSFDITFLSDGQEIEPSGEVKITFQADFITPDADPAIVHITDDGSADLMDTKIANDTITLKTDSFSVYAISYTVDFHWEVDGKQFEYRLEGGNSISAGELFEELSVLQEEMSESERKNFLRSVQSISFSNSKLVWVDRLGEKKTVKEIIKENNLSVEFSATLTEKERSSLLNKDYDAGDWVILALHPFSTEEQLNVKMSDGNVFTIDVTDAIVTSGGNDAEDGKAYVLYSKVGDAYYVLKSDGTTVAYTNRASLDQLRQEDMWYVTYVYTENSEQGNYERYIYRPCANLGSSLALNAAGNALIADGPNNIAVVPDVSGNGYTMRGGKIDSDVWLILDGMTYKAGGKDNAAVIYVYDQDTSQPFEFSVTQNDIKMGSVAGKNTDAQDDSSEAADAETYSARGYYTSKTTADKKNLYAITATPKSDRYIFDHWEMNGETVYKTNESGQLIDKNGTVITSNDQEPVALGAFIDPETIKIPYYNSTLEAVFKKNPNYNPPDDEKEGQGFSDVQKDKLVKWLTELKDQQIPLDPAGTDKTAEVYDYENRIYRVDLTARSNMKTFDGTIDLGFILDASGSMEFPSKLEKMGSYGSHDAAYYANYDINQINSGHQDDLDHGKYYYLIADKAGTATVYRLFWGSGSVTTWYGYTENRTGWWAVDASYSDNDNRRFYVQGGSTFSNDSANTKYQIYTDGRPGIKRKEDLQRSINTVVGELNSILGNFAVAKNSNEDPDVAIAYNSFYSQVNEEGKGTQHAFTSVKNGFDVPTATNGGTATDKALKDALDFEWGKITKNGTKIDTKGKNYAILITDGAPQAGGRAIANSTVIDEAEELKKGPDGEEGTEDDITLITIGLSMGDVRRGSVLLYDLADLDNNNEKLFFSAESGDELLYALYEIIQKILVDATVQGTVTDTIGEAFYPVDKNTGIPLEDGEYIDLDGNKVTADYTGFKGKIVKSGEDYQIQWDGQNITTDGWHGVVFVKAKEDLLGGNAMPTNKGDARVEAKAYKTPSMTDFVELKPDDDNNDKYITQIDNIKTPKVNVNELKFLQNETEWTVYLGTEVEPKDALKRLYENILVQEVVTRATDQDNDGLEDRMNGSGLLYPLAGDSISDKRESEIPSDSEPVTFTMNDLLKKLTAGKEYDWWDYNSGKPDYEQFFLAALSEGGIVLDYDEYGVGEADKSKITITLEKKPATATPDVPAADIEKHVTTVTGKPAETYTLKILYEPDYDVLPVGQNGKSTEDFHVGIYGTMYNGHAAGTEESVNVHKVNVYALPLQVKKIDPDGTALSGATFAIYRDARSKMEDGSGYGTTPSYVELTGNSSGESFVKVDDGTTGEDGILLLCREGTKANEKHLVAGETYYLIEKSAPDHYLKDTTVRIVTVIAQENGMYLDTDNHILTEVSDPSVSSEAAHLTQPPVFPNLYNWSQGAKITVQTGDDANTIVAATKASAIGEAGSTVELKDGEYVYESGKALKYTSDTYVFQTLIRNLKNITGFDVTKTWVDGDGEDVKSTDGTTVYSISFQVLRRDPDNSEDEGTAIELNGLIQNINDEYISLGDDKKTVTLTQYTEDDTVKWPVAKLRNLLEFVSETGDGLGTQWVYEIKETKCIPDTADPAKASITTTVDEENTILFTIKNTEKLSIEVQKLWKDKDGKTLQNPPEDKITFEVYRKASIPHKHVWALWANNENTGEWIPYVVRGNVYYKVDEQTGVVTEDTIPTNTEGVTYGLEAKLVKQATCTEDGQKLHLCSVSQGCGLTDHKKIETIPAIGHQLGEWTVVKEASITEDGLSERVCQNEGCDTNQHKEYYWEGEGNDRAEKNRTVDNVSDDIHGTSYYETRVITKIPHECDSNILVTEKDATCTEPGSAYYACSQCNQKQGNSFETPALGHSYDEGVYAKKTVDGVDVDDVPTCTQDGHKNFTCTRCGTVDVREVAATGHNYAYEDSFPENTDPENVCRPAGTRTFTCQNPGCQADDQGHSYTETIPQRDHQWGEWETYIEATETTDGENRRYCLYGCGQYKSQKVDALKETYKVKDSQGKEIDTGFPVSEYDWPTELPDGVTDPNKETTIETTGGIINYKGNQYIIHTSTKVSWAQLFNGPDDARFNDYVVKLSGRVLTKSDFAVGQEGLVTNKGDLYRTDNGEYYFTAKNDNTTFNSGVRELDKYDEAIRKESTKSGRVVDRHWSSVSAITGSTPTTNTTSNNSLRAVSARSVKKLSLKSTLAKSTQIQNGNNSQREENIHPGTGGEDSTAPTVTSTDLNKERKERIVSALKSLDSAQYGSLTTDDITFRSEQGEQSGIDVWEQYDADGRTYTITKGTDGNWKLSLENLASKDAEGNEYTYYVIETSPTEAAYEISYDNNGVSESSTNKTISITNKQKEVKVDFSFTKIWRDPLGTIITNWPTDKSITVTIKQGDDEYAKYTIGYADLQVNKQIAADGDTTGSKSKLVVQTISPAGYVFKLSGLPNGYQYSVSEDQVDGYQAPKYFLENVEQNGATSVDGGGIIKNDQVGYELPSTGGSGTMLFTILGCILVILSGTGLILWKRRRFIGIR